ncbi:LamG-like jellyroll fold domain-containing protein [Paenibacillus bovis]|uniref:Arabinanase n=1 Tax=Paenibacillus bovis TaxID=1616788 RepID=A0A172ZC67_9BACL|nr:LamG-like jellyroll fold domain-containing protein [Paenibacillus bovis]ANF95234.1 arabinanase [Paenibacillus bovis]
MRKNVTKKLAVATLAFSLAVSAAGVTNNEQASAAKVDNPPAEPTFSNATVHDPSIIKTGNTFYVFGSHISAAKSPDLLHWSNFANGYTTPGNTLYGDLSKTLAGSFKWAGENDADSKGGFAVWAPDVIWNPKYVNKDGSKGAYTLYYSTSSTYIRSAIGMAVSQKIEGPYEYTDTFIYTGFTKDKAFDANSQVDKKWTNTNIQTLIDQKKISAENPAWFNENGSYANQQYPNAIDPTIFYDAKGKMWMTYGSWSGGIFVLEVDQKTGKPIYPGKDGKTKDGRMIDRYFGTKIAGGYGKSGEGPYIQYNKDSGYFYLYMTYGGLAANGGYNMRVFRSKSADGPYVDARGHQATWPANTSNDEYGNKLIGNFLFDSKVGDPGKEQDYGYVSPGHNSVYTDPKTGQLFLVFHTRFPGRGEEHELRIHQMFINKEGWPVVSPYRYAGEQEAKVSDKMITGDYQFVDHGSDSSPAIKEASAIRLNEDHTITGELQGTWKKKGTNNAELTIGGKNYTGVFVKDWDPMSKQYVMTFTALSDQATMGWGSRLPDASDTQVIEDVYGELELSGTSGITANLELPTIGSRGTTINWTSSNEQIIAANGQVTRPESGSSAVPVTLTARITRGSETRTKIFEVTVLPYTNAQLTAQYSFDQNLNDSTGQHGAGELTGDRLDRPATVSTLTYGTGVHGQSAVLDGTTGIRLPNGLIHSNSYSVSMWVKPEQLNLYSPAFFGAADSDHWISLLPRGTAGDNTMLWAGSTPWYDASTGMKIPAGEWSHLAFSVDQGNVTVYVNGKETFTGTGFPDRFSASDNASFGLGVNYWDTPFKGELDELQVFEGSLTPAQLAELSSK